jgi:hypothetical protein
MTPRVRFAPLAATLLLALNAGCSKSTAPGGAPMDPATQTTSIALAAGALSSDMQVADAASRGGCNGAGLPLRIPSGCPLDPATGWFTCTSTGRNGLTRTFMYRFLDQGGATQAAFDSLTTASVELASTVSGTIRRARRTRTVDDRLELTISGLAGSETSRTWNGTGSSSRSDSSAAGVRTSQSNTTVADVVVPVPFTQDAWPLSGSITTHLVTSGGVDLTAVLTFNGTRYASLTVNGTTTTVDLARWLHRGNGGGPDDDEDGDDQDGEDDDGGDRGHGRR